MRRGLCGFRKALMIALLAALLPACQQAPTQAHETATNTDAATGKPIATQVILIDARPPFVSALARPNGSLQLQWEDFTQQEAPFEGELEKDLFPQARRLARMGIGPDSRIIVFGRGKAGDGEEGRLAWTLKRMGVKNVSFTTLDAIKWPSTLNAAPQLPSVPMWKPQMDETLQISRAQALDQIKNSEGGFGVLDVRVPSEFTKDPDPFGQLGLHPRFEHISWTAFLDEKGDQAPKTRYKMEALGLKPTDTIAVIDERGVGAAEAVLRLRELGYANAKLWAGGYRELRAMNTAIPKPTK